MLIKFDNTYSKLPSSFYKRVYPQPVAKPKLIYFNTKLADSFGIQYTLDEQGLTNIAKIFSGNKLPSSADPIALAYAGHQFGHFVPQLGDGRAILLGEVVDAKNNRFDMQLKGSGTTPYSRGGDGRAALGPMMRECIVSEALQALNVKTTRTLAVITTGEYVSRNNVLLPGAVLTRIAASHIRIGTFEYFAFRSDIKSLETLANYVINRHYPHLKGHTHPYIELFKHILNAQTDLIVEWMRIGFIHGVMNTDNMAISGETLDYGPCAFIDEYDPYKVFSSIDYYGRYNFSNQASICFWNLLQLAKTLALIINNHFEENLGLLHNLILTSQLQYEEKHLTMMCKKIGILKKHPEDKLLIEELLDLMHKEHADYALTFRYLSYSISDIPFDFTGIFTPSNSLEAWLPRWRHRLKKENNSLKEISAIMLKTNPAIIPRNHKIEECISHAIQDNDFSKMHSMIQALSDPYSIHNEQRNLEYIRAPKPHERVSQTFCGT